MAVTEHAGAEARRQLLALIPVAEQRLELAGISTAVLEGGGGPPLVLLHGPAGYAAHWMRVIPGLVATHRVVAPDLPGHGESGLGDGSLDAERVLVWLAELIDRTCTSPPALAGQLLGGAIAARFASRHPDRVSRLVLIDTFGLSAFRPAHEFSQALSAFLARPTEQTHERLWRQCAFDLDGLRQRMGQRWTPFAAYNLDLICRPHARAALHALLQLFESPIAAVELLRIAVPVTLIWGRHDRATPLAVAETASASYGWPLRIIDDCNDDPPIEQPEALLRELRSALATP